MEFSAILSKVLALVFAAFPLSLFVLKYLTKIFSYHNPKLGKTTTICTNVRGTLTKKSLMVRTVYFDQFKLTKDDEENFLRIENTESKEELLVDRTGLSKDETLKLLATTMTLCRYHKRKEIEQTIIEFFMKSGINRHKIDNDFKIIQKIEPIENKKTSTVVAMKKETTEIFSFSKGNPMEILKNCARILIDNKKEALTQQKRRKIRKRIEQLNSNGQRVIGLAYKPLPFKQLENYTESFTENDIIFLGLIGVTEPLNMEVIESIEEVKAAGIKTYILTETKERKAIAIAKQMKLVNPQYFESISGLYLEQISDQKMEKLLSNKEKDYIFAELKDADKLRIIDILSRQGEIVAIADSKKHTEFKSIVDGIKKGQLAEQNKTKFTQHALACKIAELILLITALIIQVPLPLTFGLIIALDLTINLLFELSLRTDRTDVKIMTAEARTQTKKLNILQLITNGLSLGIIITAIFILSLYIYGWTPGESINTTENIYSKPATITLTLLVILQVLNAFNLQSEKKSIFKFSLFKNIYLMLTTIITALLLYIFLNFDLFKIHRSATAISTLEWQLIAFFAIFIILIEEFRKFVTRKLSKNESENPA